MAPTLVPGDWALTIPLRRPKIGDVVVVEHPDRPGYEMVKRLTAVPGDRVGDRTLGPDEWWVEGDFAAASTDSRAVRPRARGRIAGQGRAHLLAQGTAPSRVGLTGSHDAPLCSSACASSRRTAVALIALLTLFGSACDRTADRASTSPHPSPSAEPSEGATRGGEGDQEGETEGQDADRIDRHGVAARTGPVRHEPTPGWRGATLFGRANDWEPATAADPSAPYVYVLTTRYSGKGPLPCASCDIPAMAFRASSDGGRTFGPVRYLQPNIPGGQFDPQLATDGAGDVLASWMDGKSRIMFSKSTDHGQTWTPARVVSHGAGWGDHPWLGVSPNGLHVYIGFNHAASWVAQSHDGGATWLPAQQVSTEDRYYFANGTAVTDDGNVVISTASYALPYSSVGRRSPIQVEVERSTDGGATFDSTIVDTVKQPRGCVSDGCPFGHYGGHAVIALSGDTLVLAYDGAVHAGGDQYLWVRRSTDFGDTWSARAAALREDARRGRDERRVSPPHRAARFASRGRTAATARSVGTRSCARRTTRARRGIPRSTSRTCGAASATSIRAATTPTTAITCRSR